MQLRDVTTHYRRASRWYDAGGSIIFDGLLRLRRYRLLTIDLLGELDGARVLDIGTGTGANLPLLVPRVGAQGEVVGIDYSKDMLARARARVAAAGWTNVTLVQGDAAELPGVEGPFDAVTSAWCLGIVADLDRALERAVSVLRCGGTFSIMDFHRSHPDHGLLHWLFLVYAPLLRASGIDSAEDLEDGRLAARWERGRIWLTDNLEITHTAEYLLGTGFVLAGRKP